MPRVEPSVRSLFSSLSQSKKRHFVVTICSFIWTTTLQLSYFRVTFAFVMLKSLAPSLHLQGWLLMEYVCNWGLNIPGQDSKVSQPSLCEVLAFKRISHALSLSDKVFHILDRSPETQTCKVSLTTLEVSSVFLGLPCLANLQPLALNQLWLQLRHTLTSWVPAGICSHRPGADPSLPQEHPALHFGA